MLKQYLESHLVKHKDVSKLLAGFNAPVGTFSSRILLSFAVGLISEAEYVMLGNIKKIRNEFAHSVQASFETPTISSHCRTLSEIPIVKSVMKSVKAGKELDPKFVFRITSALMILTVQDRLPEATDQRLSLTYAKSTPPI